MKHTKTYPSTKAVSSEQPHTFMDDLTRGQQEGVALVCVALFCWIAWRMMLRGARQVGRAWRDDRR